MYKNYAILILLFILTVSSFLLYTIKKKNDVLKHEIEVQQSNIETLNTSIYKFKTLSGEDAAKNSLPNLHKQRI